MSIALGDRTVAVLEAMFSGADRGAAVTLLTNDCGDNLAGYLPKTPTGLDRPRIAALRLSGGRIAALYDAIALAQEDWRDLLVEAEFANDVTAHERWMP